MVPGAGVLKDDPGPGKVGRVVYCTVSYTANVKNVSGVQILHLPPIKDIGWQS
jgi:hypothetical protein